MDKAVQTIGMGLLVAFVGIVLAVLGYQQEQNLEIAFGAMVIAGSGMYVVVMFTKGGVDMPPDMDLMDYIDFAEQCIDWAREHAADTVEMLEKWKAEGYFARFGKYFDIDDDDAAAIIEHLIEIEKSNTDGG